MKRLALIPIATLILSGCTSSLTMEGSGNVYEYGRFGSLLEPSIGILEQNGTMIGVWSGSGFVPAVAGAAGQIGAAVLLEPARTDVSANVSGTGTTVSIEEKNHHNQEGGE